MPTDRRKPSLTAKSAVALFAVGLTLAGCATQSATPTASADVVAMTPRLSSADNFRELGGLGAGYPTVDGHHLTRGVVFRSNALSLTPADAAIVSDLSVTEIIDLRTPAEIQAKPDTTIAGAKWINYNVIGETAVVAPQLSTAAESTAMMTDIYRQFVASATSRKEIAATLTAIAKNTGATIIHCTAGKDRTGWTSALLLHIAGASPELINQDYLLSNQYSRSSNNATLAGVTAKGGPGAAAPYAPLLGVQQKYLDASYDQVKSDYGTVENYLTHGLGLSQATLTSLKNKLTN